MGLFRSPVWTLLYTTSYLSGFLCFYNCKTTNQTCLLRTLRYHIQPGNKRPPRSLPGALVTGGLGASTRCRAGLGALLAGGVGVGVPRAVPVGAVAHGALVDVHALPCWDHLVPSKAVGTYRGQEKAARKKRLTLAPVTWSTGIRGPQRIKPTLKERWHCMDAVIVVCNFYLPFSLSWELK